VAKNDVERSTENRFATWAASPCLVRSSRQRGRRAPPAPRYLGIAGEESSSVTLMQDAPGARRSLPCRTRDPKRAMTAWSAAGAENPVGWRKPVRCAGVPRVSRGRRAYLSAPSGSARCQPGVICMQYSGEVDPDSRIVHGLSRVYGISRQRSQKNSRPEVFIMNRRDFLQSGGFVSVSLAFAKAERLFHRSQRPIVGARFKYDRVEV